LGSSPPAVPHSTGRRLPEQRHRGFQPEASAAAVFDAYGEIEKLSPEDPEDYPLWRYGRSRPFSAFRDVVAAFVGCSRDEIALTRNATEGINLIVNGCEMKLGDERQPQHFAT
jgi:hypothetical protein